MENDIYVVCWLDGTEAIAMAGTRNSEGKISPLAVERRTALPGSITNGVIAVNDENRKLFADLVRCVANHLTTTFSQPYIVRKIYVVAMPRSMRSVVTSAEKVLETRRLVRVSDIEECRAKAHEERPADSDLIVLYENDFDLDGKSARHACDELAKKLRLNALSVIVNKRFSTDYRMLLPKDVTFAGTLPASVASALAVTTTDERFEGVVSVHFCNSTTLFTAYRDGNVVATCVVPLGEVDVIHDLCSGVCENSKDRDAVWRRIYDKWNFVSAESDLRVSDSLGNVLVDAEKAKHMSFDAETRMAEIYNIGMDWLRAQIAGFDETIKNVVFSGLVTDKSGFGEFASTLAPDLQCRCGNADAITTDNKYHDDVNYVPLIGAMLQTTSGCVELKPVPVVEQQPVPAPADDDDDDESAKKKKKKKSRSGFFGLGDLFNNENDNL